MSFRAWSGISQKIRLYYLGDSSEGGTPDPISNSVVKPFSSDDTLTPIEDSKDVKVFVNPSNCKIVTFLLSNSLCKC